MLMYPVTLVRPAAEPSEPPAVTEAAKVALRTGTRDGAPTTQKGWRPTERPSRRERAVWSACAQCRTVGDWPNDWCSDGCMHAWMQTHRPHNPDPPPNVAERWAQPAHGADQTYRPPQPYPMGGRW